MTLIELVVVIVVVALAIPALLNTWASIAWRSMTAEGIADAGLYQEEILEEIKARRFDEKVSRPWTDASLFGCGRSDETDETNRTAFDDIDDYHNYTDQVAGFTRRVDVGYINSSGTAWVAVAGPSDFKRVTVTVSRSHNPVNVSMSAMISGR